MKKRMTPAQLANLKQNRGKSLEQLEEIVQGAEVDYRNEARVQEYIAKVESEYDVTEMNHNDRSALQDLARISIDIEDTENRYRDKLSQENVDWFELEKIVGNLKILRADRSKIEYDLNISRRSRQGAEEVSVVDAIDSFKKRAKKMLEERLNYVYCDCGMLLATVWFLTPDAGNSLTLTCSRSTCGKKIVVTGSELIAKRNRNREDMLET